MSKIVVDYGNSASGGSYPVESAGFVGAHTKNPSYFAVDHTVGANAYSALITSSTTVTKQMTYCDFSFINSNFTMSVTAKANVKIRVTIYVGTVTSVNEYTLSNGDTQTLQRASTPSTSDTPQGFLVEVYA